MSGFSERLSALRRGAGMTQAELAKKLGISKSSVSMYECGNREPEFDLLEKMADLLQVDMNVLLGRGEPLVNNDPELTAYLEALRDRPEMRALFRLSQNATREDVETAVTILEALRSKHEDTLTITSGSWTFRRRCSARRSRTTTARFPYTSTPVSAMTRGAKRCGTSSSTWRGITFTATLPSQRRRRRPAPRLWRYAVSAARSR